MERRLGHDFSRVRVHTDSRAAESARAVNALAYTVGSNVVFGVGQFAPDTRTGQKTLGHELVHVMQQGRAQTFDALEIGALDDPREVEAEAIAIAASSDGTVPQAPRQIIKMPGRPNSTDLLLGRIQRALQIRGWLD